VHLWHNIVVVHVGSVLIERSTVDVERGGTESILIVPLLTGSCTGDEVDRLYWVVEIAEIQFGVSVGGWLVLSLSEEDLVLGIGEVSTFISIKIYVVTVNLGSTLGGVTVAALDAKFHLMIL